MGLADDLESNLDELFQQTVRVNAQDSFNVAIAATVRSVVRRSGPALQIVRRATVSESASSGGASVDATGESGATSPSAAQQAAHASGISHPFAAAEPAAGEHLETPDADLVAAAAQHAAAQAAARNAAAR